MSEAITRLEEKVAYLERHVVEQDKAMLELSERLTRLERELALLKLRQAQVSGGTDAQSSSNDERPPHY